LAARALAVKRSGVLLVESPIIHRIAGEEAINIVTAQENI
jgi:hypothetical protein